MLNKLNMNVVKLASLSIIHQQRATFIKFAHDHKRDWKKALGEAEKIVGYPTSFLSLRWLLSDEVANVALHLRKLVDTNHPILKTAKSLVYSDKDDVLPWGLVVLLISKTAGHSSNIPDLEQDKAAGVLHKQRALAEITEMIRTSHLIHKCMANIKPTDEESDMQFGNKIALLSGDYLLSTSCMGLGNLRNQEVFELMSGALRDQIESEFVGLRDGQHNPLPGKPRVVRGEIGEIGSAKVDPLVVKDALGSAEAEWTLRNVLCGGSLLGKSCQSTLNLAGHSEELQEEGYSFGKHLALAWQAYLDRKSFGKHSEGFSLVSAPVLFELEKDPGLYTKIEEGMEDVSKVDYETIRSVVLSGSGLERTKDLQKKSSETALNVLKLFPQSHARYALSNIIFAMQES